MRVVRPGAVARADRPLRPGRATRCRTPGRPSGPPRTPRGRTEERSGRGRRSPRRASGIRERSLPARRAPSRFPRRGERRASRGTSATRPQVEDDVEDRAADTPHELRLLVRGSLEMHAAESSRPGRAGDARTARARRQAGGGELVRVPDPGEEPALVLVALELDDDCAGNRGLRRTARSTRSTVSRHRSPSSSSPSSSRWRSWPGGRSGGPRRARSVSGIVR